MDYRILSELHQRFKWYGYLAFLDNTTPLKFNHEEHKRLAEATMKRKIKLACQLMHEHIGDPYSMIIPILKKRNLLKKI